MREIRDGEYNGRTLYARGFQGSHFLVTESTSMKGRKWFDTKFLTLLLKEKWYTGTGRLMSISVLSILRSNRFVVSCAYMLVPSNRVQIKRTFCKKLRKRATSSQVTLFSCFLSLYLQLHEFGGYGISWGGNIIIANSLLQAGLPKILYNRSS
jgi:hypothetical protein